MWRCRIHPTCTLQGDLAYGATYSEDLAYQCLLVIYACVVASLTTGRARVHTEVDLRTKDVDVVGPTLSRDRHLIEGDFL